MGVSFPAASGLLAGTAANLPENPTVGQGYIETDGFGVHVCRVGGSWDLTSKTTIGAGTDVLLRDDAYQASSSSTSMQPLNSIEISVKNEDEIPTLDLRYEHKYIGGNSNVRTQIYKNAASFGSLVQPTSTSFVEVSCEIDVADGDVLTVYGCGSGSSYTAHVQNFRLLGEIITQDQTISAI